MNATERDEAIESLVDRLVEDPSATRPEGTSSADWDEAVELAPVAAALRSLAETPPPLALDRTAAMLGLIPAPGAQLDSASLVRLRKAAHLPVSELAARLQRRGWDVTAADVFRWESRSVHDVPPAMITALAAVIGVPQDRLTRATGTSPVSPGLEQLSRSPEFGRLAERLAALRRVSTAIAESMLQSTALATVKRGAEPDADQWLIVLTGYVDAMEAHDEA